MIMAFCIMSAPVQCGQNGTIQPDTTRFMRPQQTIVAAAFCLFVLYPAVFQTSAFMIKQKEQKQERDKNCRAVKQKLHHYCPYRYFSGSALLFRL